MALIHYRPARPFDSGFDRFFAGFGPGSPWEGNGERAPSFSPRVELSEDDEAIELSAEIPGIDRDSVKVEILDRQLTLSGEKKAAGETSEKGVVRSERTYGSFERRFTLPPTVDTEKIVASHENGVLKLRIPKKPDAKPRQIDVQ